MVLTTVVFPFLVANLHWILPNLIVAAFLRNYYKKQTSQPTDRENNRPMKKKAEIREKADVSEEEDEDDEGPKSAIDENLEHIPYKYTSRHTEEMIQRSQLFYQSMNERRSLRFYSKKLVPQEIMENIIRTAGTAPSGAHTEPWTYIVVSKQSLKDSIREIIENEELVNYQQRMGDQWTADLKGLKTDWNKPYLSEAPYLVLLFKQTHGYMPDQSKKVHYYNEISCSISAGLFLAAVQQAGLVTLTSTPLNCGPALRSILDRPDNEKLLMLLPVGYPAEGATVPRLERKPLHEISQFIQ